MRPNFIYMKSTADIISPKLTVSNINKPSTFYYTHNKEPSYTNYYSISSISSIHSQVINAYKPITKRWNKIYTR